MAALNQVIDTLVAGDTWKIIRNFTGIPTGNTFSKVYLTIKRSPTDGDGSAVIQKSVTASATADGQITAQDAGAGTISFFFTLAAATSALLTPGTIYHYDLMGVAGAGVLYTFETESTIFARRGVTDATS